MLKAIETSYKGYKFRSRLEARWAVFFDSLHIKWEYEKEGFNLPSGPYLPDFFLPDIHGGLWTEIKAEEDRTLELAEEKLKDLSAHLEVYTALFIGDPYRGYEQGLTYNQQVHWLFIGPEIWDMDYIFCVCPECGKVGYEYEGRGDRVCGSSCGITTDRGHNGDSDRIYLACIAARAVRFEHKGRK